MRPAELEKMFRLEDTYWWFVARRDIALHLVKRFLGHRNGLAILDVGCGTGATLKELEPLGSVVGLDCAPEALAWSRRRTQSPLELASAEHLPFPAASFDLVTALDVLEHLDRDDLAAREIARVLRPGGLLIATVPAMPSLWSEHDEALDHRRRYRSRSFQRLLGEAGLETELLSHTLLVLFPAVFVFRLLQRLRRRPRQPKTTLIPLPPILNGLLIGLLRLESRLLPRLRLPFGVSLIAVARKAERVPQRAGWAPLQADAQRAPAK